MLRFVVLNFGFNKFLLILLRRSSASATFRSSTSATSVRSAASSTSFRSSQLPCRSYPRFKQRSVHAWCDGGPAPMRFTRSCGVRAGTAHSHHTHKAKHTQTAIFHKFVANVAVPVDHLKSKAVPPQFQLQVVQTPGEAAGWLAFSHFRISTSSIRSHVQLFFALCSIISIPR